jgi:hypothetical protein
MDINNLKGLMEAYQQVNAPQEVDEAKQSFPAKKVAKQMEKARKGSVYGKELKNEPSPQVSDSEKKETRRYSKMFHASEKAKREKQEADKARRSSTFYKDTHPASAPKMKKANEQLDLFDVVLEFLQAEGYAETLEEAEWMMANLIDEEAIAIIVEAMNGEEDEEEMKKGKKSKKSEEEDEEDEEEEIDEQQRPIYSRGGEQRRTQTPRQIGVKSAPHNIPKGGTTISDRDPEGKRLFSGEQDRGKGNKAARRAAALKPQEKRFPNRLRRADGQGIRDSYEMRGNSLDIYQEFEAWLDEAMTNYEKNRKRAAQRAAARNEARKQGKTGAVPGVGYVTPRPERETWTDESGKTRHAKGL